jgi:hypothetical protein
MEVDGILYGLWVHFTVFCYILWTFGIVRGNLVYFSPFRYFVPRKIWQPCNHDQWSASLLPSTSLYMSPTYHLNRFLNWPAYVDLTS